MAMIITGQLQAPHHVELAFAATRGTNLILRFGRKPTDDRLGLEGLKFDDVGARIGGGIDQLQGHVEGPVVIDTGFGDDEAPFRPIGHDYPFPSAFE
jgi:hypothetical protein